MPQFDPSSFASQIFWLVISFTLMYVLVGRFAFPKIQRVIEARAERIGRDLAEAEQLRAQTDATLKAYEAALKEAHAKAVAATAEAVADAAKSAAAKGAEADAKIAARVDAAVATIDAAREAALGNLRSIAVGLAQDITDKLTGVRPSEQTAAAKVDAALSKKAA